jgi:hypothetical protein
LEIAAAESAEVSHVEKFLAFPGGAPSPKVLVMTVNSNLESEEYSWRNSGTLSRGRMVTGTEGRRERKAILY